VTPKNGLNFSVVAMGALLLEDKERARAFARVARKLLDDLERTGLDVWSCCMCWREDGGEGRMKGGRMKGEGWKGKEKEREEC
jgi:hypothetical protein